LACCFELKAKRTLSPQIEKNTALSNQFKKMTGLTPTHFKNLKNKKRSVLGDM